jgi:hypothetical protein
MDRLETIERMRDEKRVNALEAARTLGYPERYFHGKPWRMPNFSQSGSLHALSVWREWMQRPEVDRRSEWEALPLNARRRARGLA